MPEWMMTTGTVLMVMILWDCVRLFLQAYVNKLFLRKDFDKIDQAIDDVEEAIDEENGNGKSKT